MSVHVFVEGGGDQPRTLTACRKAFRLLFEKVLGENPRPSVSACGSRNEAYGDFRRSLQQNPGTFAILLVDAEGPVAVGASTWRHLRSRDGWRKPAPAQDKQAHLMVECMEAWFLADSQKLVDYYGHKFKRRALPRNPQIEQIAKLDLMDRLERATKDTLKGKYHKTRHGFDILARIDPAAIRRRSRHADAFFAVLLERLVP